MGQTPYFLVMSRVLRGISILCFTAALFPLAAAVCLPCYVLATVVQVVKRQSPMTGDMKTVMILSGAKGKALHIGRLFKAEGYKVIMAEHRLYPFVGASFRKYVDAFYYLRIPKEDPHGTKLVLQIVKEHNPHLMIPIDPRTVELDVQLFCQLPETCVPLACDAKVFLDLDNKDTFMASLNKGGIRAPRTQLVTSKREAFDILKGKSKDYVLKPIFYDDLGRCNIHPREDLQELDKFLEENGVSPTRPHVIQEKLEGPELTSVCFVFNNHLIAHTAGFSGPVYQTQNHMHCEELIQWTEDFVKRYPGRLTGWFSFDYMKSATDGKYYPLECNPRLGTSFIMFTPEDGVIPLLQQHLDLVPNRLGTKHPSFSQKAQKNPTPQIRPERIIEPRRKQIYYLMNILWEMVSSPLNVTVWKGNVGILLRGHEAMFSVLDPLPFLALNFLQMPV
ncbi:hypothetical protein ACOMHN_028961 [Nucella lapillus]